MSTKGQLAAVAVAAGLLANNAALAQQSVAANTDQTNQANAQSSTLATGDNTINVEMKPVDQAINVNQSTIINQGGNAVVISNAVQYTCDDEKSNSSYFNCDESVVPFSNNDSTRTMSMDQIIELGAKQIKDYEDAYTKGNLELETVQFSTNWVRDDILRVAKSRGIQVKEADLPDLSFNNRISINNIDNNVGMGGSGSVSIRSSFDRRHYNASVSKPITIDPTAQVTYQEYSFSNGSGKMIAVPVIDATSDSSTATTNTAKEATETAPSTIDAGPNF